KVEHGSRALTPHRSGPATRFPVSDLFLRPLAGLLPHRTEDSKGDPCGRETFSVRSLGRAYRCAKPLRMGKHPGISCGTTTAHSVLALLTWRPPVPLRF